jgi:YHS domain
MATVTDPVCGMEIDSAAAAASEEYQGKTYYSCSQGATSGLWPRRSSTPSERAVWSSWFALPTQVGVGEEAALVFCQ